MTESAESTTTTTTTKIRIAPLAEVFINAAYQARLIEQTDYARQIEEDRQARIEAIGAGKPEPARRFFHHGPPPAAQSRSEIVALALAEGARALVHALTPWCNPVSAHAIPELRADGEQEEVTLSPETAYLLDMAEWVLVERRRELVKQRAKIKAVQIHHFQHSIPADLGDPGLCSHVPPDRTREDLQAFALLLGAKLLLGDLLRDPLPGHYVIPLGNCVGGM